MTLRSMTERARQIVFQTISEDEPEVDRMLVSGALVVREGSHYRIADSGDQGEDLARLDRQSRGLCDCGGLLSSSGSRLWCRSCSREYSG